MLVWTLNIWHTYLSFLNYLCRSHTLKHFELIQRLNGVLLRWKVFSFNVVFDSGVAWEQRHHSVVTTTAIYKIESFHSEIFLLTSKWTISVCPSNSQVFPDRGRCQLDTNRKVECSHFENAPKDSQISNNTRKASVPVKCKVLPLCLKSLKTLVDEWNVWRVWEKSLLWCSRG